MKYLKLFEAFNSNKLSKVLSYIDKYDKPNFVYHLKVICNDFDFPISELNDSFFKYLPYKKALYTKYEGENNDTDVKIIKFWFTKDGSYLTTSYDDGATSDQTFSPNPDNYEIGDVVKGSELKNEDLVCVELGDGNPLLIGKILKDDEDENKIHIIHNNKFYDGSEPVGIDWRKLGKYSWYLNLDEHSSYKSIKRAKLVSEDPWLYNKKYTMLTNYYNYQSKIKEEADFAIILDVEKLKNSEHKSLYGLLDVRSKSKEGATALMDNDVIKNINIERYLSKLAEKHDIISDIANVNSIINRILGKPEETLFIIFTYGSSIMDFLENLSSYYYQMILNKKQGYDFDHYVKSIDNLVKTQFKKSLKYNSTIKEIVIKLKKKCEEQELEKESEILDALQKLSIVVSEKLTSNKLECIEDIDITFEKIRSIKNLIKRYIDHCAYFLNSFDGSNSFYYLTGHYHIQSRISEIMDDIDRCVKTINRV